VLSGRPYGQLELLESRTKIMMPLKLQQIMHKKFIRSHPNGMVQLPKDFLMGQK
jgi:hypothetical protein